MDFGSDDILAAFSAVEELASMAPAASTPPCNIDMYNSDLMISALKKS
jgi:preprotein translocase subunit Sec63